MGDAWCYFHSISRLGCSGEQQAKKESIYRIGYKHLNNRKRKQKDYKKKDCDPVSLFGLVDLF